MSGVRPAELGLTQTTPPALPEVDVFLPTVPARVGANLASHIAELEESQAVLEPFLPAFRYALLNEEAHRIRPALTYVTALACGINPDGIDEYATAMEEYHTMAIVLDDLPAHDNSDERRLQPTLWRAFDVSTVEMTAAHMTSVADLLVGNTDLRYRLDRKLSEYVVGGLGRLSVGQKLDLGLKGRSNDDVSPEELDEIADLKTAAAIEMCIVGVALISRLPRELIKHLKDYSRYYGIAFQIQDDLIDSLKGPNGSGKTHDLDRKNRKPNYPAVLGVAGAQERFEHYTALAAGVAAEHISPTLDTSGFEKIVRHIANPANHR